MYETLLSLEKDFFKLSCISSREWLDAVLHDDFSEVGKSGILFDKEETMEGLLSCKSDRDIVIYNFCCEEIGENSWMVHYVTESEDGLIYRTSIWSKETRMQLRFHQATKLNCRVELRRCFPPFV